MRTIYDTRVGFESNGGKKLDVDMRATVATDELPRHQTGVAQIAGEATEEILFSLAPARLIMLQSDQEVDVVFNGSVGPITLQPLGDPAVAVFTLSGEITSIQVHNLGTDPACVIYALAGE